MLESHLYDLGLGNTLFKLAKMSTDSLLPSGMFVMGGSFVFFRSLSALVRRMPVPVGAQETRRKTWTYWNILVSFIHSFITACLSTYW